MKKIDLHTHTNISDGQFSPEELVDLAIKNKLSAIAITDHDAVKGCGTAITYAKGKGLEIVSGIEISCYEEEFGFVEVHILGLFVDYKNNNLIEFCENIRKERIGQKKKIIEKLQRLGYDISFEEVSLIAGYSFGRPHVARILVNKYPKEFPDVKSVFNKLLAEGKPAYVGRENKTRVKDAIRIIKKAGGVSLLAHPGVYDQKNRDKLIGYFLKLGGQGLETYYPYDMINGLKKGDSIKLNSSFRSYASKNNLLQSGGSDFHGVIRKTVAIGQIQVPYNLLEKIKDYLNL